MLANTVGLFISKFVLPLLFLSALLHIVSTLTDQYKLTKLADLLRNLQSGHSQLFSRFFWA
ncbi:hypothetical protein QS257_09500 [Terrilactibacillus sp. S3-3]|nr:hypothetical protein QS257_09500 [Terrilactibacillus sp. S3-3]